ncbi:MAG: AMP-binding protein [Bryobacteraceae bacterium]
MSISYVQGPERPLIEDPINVVFRRTAAEFPDRLALVSCHQEIHLTWSELAARVEETARGLRGLGLQPGDRFGVWATNSIEWVCLQLAAARAGLVQVNVNPAYRANELNYVIRKSRMRALFLAASDARSDYQKILLQATHEPVASLEYVVYLGEPSWDSFLANGVDIEPFEQSARDVVNIQYTSGTTGSPKGVLLTHRNLVNNGDVIATGLRISEEDRLCVPVPMYHCFGCVGGTMVMITRGAAMILPAASFDPLATMEAIEDERCTSVYGVPTMFIAQLTHPDFSQFDFSSLRTGVMAGAPCPIEIMNRVVDDMHCPQMTIMYGQTESSPVITMATVDDDLDRRVSTVGCACMNTEVKIANPGGETVPVGEQGELCTRGYLVMKGYDEEPEATARAVDKDGWLRTGDLSIMRPDGYFRITGRIKDMIIRGGENIYPREVEEYLYTHPKVADVQVVGLPDARLGESVAAWIKLKPGEECTEDEICEFCKGQIAHFKIPAHIRFVDEFPMTVTGKIQKFQIRQFEVKALGLESAASIETA